MSAERQTVWLEVLSRHDEVIARHRVELRPEKEGVLVGRGYDNDIVLDDPYVAARHLRIARDASGALVAEDLGSANGLFVNQDRRRVASVSLAGGPTLRVGRTRLRIRQAGDAVPPERIARPRARLWPAVTLLALVALGGEFVTMWLRETTEQKLSAYVGPLVMLCVTVAAWTSAWSVMSRIFCGRGRFERHLLIALGGVVALWALNELSPFVAYALSHREVLAYRYIGQWLIGGVMCFLHLRQVTVSREGGRGRLKLQAGAMAALTALGIGMQTLSQWEATEHADRLVYLRTLKPPELRLASAQNRDAFFAEVAGLRERLDQSRSDSPGRAWSGDDEE
ncbi:MAG TPA: FHA domain-containing protein [Burkholderiales bacterium]|nr:FHA domain-containing protein [Burkholderiales bacterium]